MSFSFEVKPYTCLSFDEVNILIQNFRKQDQGGILARLDNVLKHTKDPELQSLLKKLRDLTSEEYSLLVEDIEAGIVVFPPNYALPHL